MTAHSRRLGNYGDAAVNTSVTAHSRRLGNFGDPAVDNVSDKHISDECLGGLSDDARHETSANNASSVDTATSNDDDEGPHLYAFEG